MNNTIRKSALIVMAILYFITSICGTILIGSVANGNFHGNFNEVLIATIVWLVLMPIMICVAARAKHQ